MLGSRTQQNVRNENAICGPPRTAGPTGRKKMNAVAFSTPATGASPKSRLKTENIHRTASKHTALLEKTKKTPFSNAQNPVTPIPLSLKPSKSFTVFNDTSDVLSARRISSTRSKLRLPRSVSKSFETPKTRGDHWDVSDASMEVSVIEEASETAEDYDDVEYGPPTAIDPGYDPPFEMPDYKEVGATLMSLFRQHTILDDYDPVAEFDNTDILAELEELQWNERLELPEIPVENIFPSMIRPERPQSLTTENRSQAPIFQSSSEAILPGLVGHRQAVPRLGRKASVQIHKAASVRQPPSLSKPLPANITSKPLHRMITSHTRIPSLKSAVQMAPSVAQAENPTGSYSRATSVSHLRATSLSRPRIPNTLHSRNTDVSKPLTQKIHKARLHSLEDTKQYLFEGMEDEVPGEEVLFNV